MQPGWNQLCSDLCTPCTDGSVHGNQPVKSRKSRRSLHQGGPSWMSAPVTSALAQETGIPICKPPYLHLSPILSQTNHREAGQTTAKGHDHPPPISTGGQKQLSPWPIVDLAATVDSTQLTKSSRNFLQSRRNSLFR